MKRMAWIAAAAAVAAVASAAALAQPFGGGPGMMGNWGGWGGWGGQGSPMMGGPMMGGGWMGGPHAGWMGGPGARWGLRDLNDEQRTKIDEIALQFRREQFELMQQMHKLAGVDGPGALDEQAERGRFDAMTALRKQMFENRLAMRKRIDGVLTPQQREEWRRGYGRG